MTSQQSLRIGVFGQFGIGNLGNEGSLEAMLRLLRTHAPSADLVCICSDPDLVSRAHGVDCVPIRSAWGKSPFARVLNKGLLGMPARLANVVHSIKHTAGLDVFLIPGTGIFDDFGESPLGLPYELWRWCRSARLGGAKVGFVSVGAGPITHWLSRRFMKGAASCGAYRSYRDAPSKAFANSIRMGAPQDPVFPDIAFSLPAPGAARSTPSSAPIVAVGVMAYYGWDGSPDRGRAVYADYIGKISAYVLWLIETGRRVSFVIGKDKDAEAVEDVRRKVLAAAPGAADQLEPFHPAANLEEVMQQFADADIAVVTRFHNLVCALKAGRAAVSLGYAEKNHALLVEMGLGEFSQEVERFDVDVLKAHTEQIFSERATCEAAVRRKVADFGAQLRAQERLLAEEFLRAAPSVGVADPSGMPADPLERPVIH